MIRSESYLERFKKFQEWLKARTVDKQTRDTQKGLHYKSTIETGGAAAAVIHEEAIQLDKSQMSF